MGSSDSPSHPHRPASPEGSQVNIMGVHTVPGSPNTLHRTVATNTPPSPALQRRLGQASPSLARHPPPAAGGIPSSPLIGRKAAVTATGVPPSPLMSRRHCTPDEMGAASRQGSVQPPVTPAFPVSPQLPEKRHMSSGDAERTDNKNLTPTPASGGSTPNLTGTHTLPDVSKSIYGETLREERKLKHPERLKWSVCVSLLQQMVTPTLRWMWSLFRIRPSSGTSRTFPENKVRRSSIQFDLTLFFFFLLHPTSHFGLFFLSHQSAEGQGARGVHHPGQSFVQGSVRPRHEGGLPATDYPTEQERSLNHRCFILVAF